MEVSVHNNSNPKTLYLKTDKGEYVIREGSIRMNIGLLKDQDLIKEVRQQLSVLNKEQLRKIGEHLLHDYDEPMGLCTSCKGPNHLVPQSNWGCPTGSYVYKTCTTGASECPKCGEEDSLKVHQKSGSSATKATVYKCEQCGKKVRGITTG